MVMQDIFVAALVAMFFVFSGQNAQDSYLSQTQIRQVILSLPPDSEMRRYLERGDRGDGVHYAWMDQMKDLGVKRAKIFLDFKWSVSRKHPVDIRLRRIALYKSYDGNCDQIVNPEQ